MQLNLKPTHAPVTAYYQALSHFGHLYVDHEMAVRSAFQDLLAKCGRKVHLTLVPEYRIERARGSSVIVDGALVDTFHLPHGYWEAKDEKDDLEKEVKLKLEKGYPRDNIIFQSPTRAILYQAGMRVRGNQCGADTPVRVVSILQDSRSKNSSPQISRFRRTPLGGAGLQPCDQARLWSGFSRRGHQC